jgi:hypothetical protein
MMLRHDMFGCVTHFQSLVGTNIPHFTPKRTDGCMKGILKSTPSKASLQTPDPQVPAKAHNWTWLPTIHKFFPHTWIDAGLVTEKAVKSDKAFVPTHLWDQRCAMVLLHVSLALDQLQ